MGTPAEEPDLDVLPRGEVVHRYTIDGVIGRGDFGVTYRVRDTTGEPFVLKEYFPRQFARRLDGKVVPSGASEQAAYYDGLGRFLEEARALRLLTAVGGGGGGVVRVVTFFEDNDTGYIAMEPVTGRRLDAVLAAHKQGLHQNALEPLAHHLLEALSQVHGARFRHGDIRPANIMLREDGRPALLDFGVARNASAGRTAAAKIAVQGYAPIEQWLGTEQGTYSDVYSLGAMLYEAIGGTSIDAVTRHQALLDGNGDPQPPAVEIGAGRFDLLLLRMIDRATAVLPEMRPQSAAALLALLDGVDSGTAPPPRTALKAAEQSAVDTPDALRSVGEASPAGADPAPAPEQETSPARRIGTLPFLAGTICVGLFAALAVFLLKPAGPPPASVPSAAASLIPAPAHDLGPGPEPAVPIRPAAPPPAESPRLTDAESAKPSPVEAVSHELDKPGAVEPPKLASAVPSKPPPVPPPKPAAPTANAATPVPEPAAPARQAAIRASGDRPPEAPARDARAPTASPAPPPPLGGPPDGPVGNRLSGPALVYPPAQEKNGREGSADITCTVGANGRTSDCKVVKLWGPPDFGASALAYVSGSTYDPARRDGVNVSEDATFHIKFEQSR